MKLSLNWIKDYVNLPDSVTPQELAVALTMATVEVEGVESLKESFNLMVVGQILAVEAHPRADLLRVVTTDIGEDKPVVIVCGGSNLEVGQKVAVSLPGSMVRWHGEGELVEIKATKLRGVDSYGMICAAGEIGLEALLPADSDELIIDLSFLDAPAGTPLADALDLNDYLFEIDNKSLTNRPDLWGHYGIAREIAAIYDLELLPLPKVELPSVSGIEVKIENPDDCRRFSAMTVTGLINQPSPFWLKNRLAKVGQRPIDVLVDITNYVMLTTGQPTHGYDKNHVKGFIDVRRGRPGETLELLNGDVLNVGEENLLITDEKGVIGLAGVMGGKLDSIYSTTTELIMEAANFHPIRIRHTAHQFGHRTEASTRYEKSIDTQRVDQAIHLTAHLIHELQPQAKITALTDNYPQKTEPVSVSVGLDFLEARLGRTLEVDQMIRALSKLGFDITFRDGVFHTVAPTWRSTGDIEAPEDIVEEEARMLGYDKLTFVEPKISLTGAIRQLDYELERSLREYLAHTQASQEIFTYPWVKDELLQAAGNTGPFVTLDVPPAPDMKRLRNSLVPGILGAISQNLHHDSEFRLFELTQVFSPGEVSPSDEREKLPLMERNLAGAFVGGEPTKLFLEVKGMLEDISRAVSMDELAFDQVVKPAWADGKLWLNIRAQGEVIGSFGLLSLRSAKAVGIKRAQSVVYELNVEKLTPLPSRQNTYERLPEFPLVEYDISLIVDESVSWREIEQLVKPMVKSVEFVDVFRSEQVGEGKKSLTLRVWFQSKDGTMTMEQVDKRARAIVKNLNKQVGAFVRGME